MSIPTDEAMRNAARAVYEVEGSVEIDEDAPISRDADNTDKGAYVQAWVWVYDEDAANDRR